MAILKLRLTLAVVSCLAASVCPVCAQFAPSPNNPFFSGHNPVGIVSAYLNTDNIPDLAVANQTDGTVTVLLGDGLGNFTPAATGPTMNGVFPVTGSPSAIVAGDFNKDGKIDLAVTDITGGNVTILFGDGTGGFPNMAKIPTTGKSPIAMAAMDFDGDGNLDLAIANLTPNSAAGTVTILFGNGKGMFQAKPAVTLTAGKFPIAIVAADLDGDGTPDLAVANEGSGTVTVFIDPGKDFKSRTMTLKSTVIPMTPSLTQSVSAIAAANFTGHLMNEHGVMPLDLAVTYYDNTSLQGNVLLFIADEKGGYNPPTKAFFPSSIGLQPVAIATGVFGLGDYPGVAIANYRSNKVAVYAGDGVGGLTASTNSPYATGVLPRAIAVADFNGDGLSDVAVANYNDGTVTVLLNTFATVVSMVSAASNTAPVAPGSLATIYGTGLGSPANLSGTSVMLTDSSGVATAMTIVFSTPTQINALVPPAAATGMASFSVTTMLGSPQKSTVMINSVAPGLFSANASGKGPAAAYIQSLVTNNNPIPVYTCPVPPTGCQPVSFDVSTGTTSLVLYGTGIRNRAQLTSVTATVGGTMVPVFYAGQSPTYPGVDQVNLSLPASLAHAGTVFVQVAIGSAMSNMVTVAIE